MIIFVFAALLLTAATSEPTKNTTEVTTRELVERGHMDRTK